MFYVDVLDVDICIFRRTLTRLLLSEKTLLLKGSLNQKSIKRLIENSAILQAGLRGWKEGWVVPR